MSAKIFHIPFITLASGLKLHSIVQRTPRQGSSAPDDHPAVRHYTTVEDLLADPEVDLVVITTPPNSHFELASQILKSHKNVLVEKPFVPTSQQADELLKVADENSRVICVYQNRRWDADFLTVKSLVEEDKLGRIVEFETHFDRYRPEKSSSWKSQLGLEQGGGAIFDLGVHLIDQVYALFGMPSTVYGKLVNQREGKFNIEDSDGVNAMLCYNGTGMVAHVRIGVLSVEQPQPRFWIRGSRGTYRKLGLDPQEDQLKAGIKANEPNFGIEDARLTGSLSRVSDIGEVEVSPYPTVAAPTYLELYRRLAQALESQKQEDIPVSAQEAKNVLVIIEAIQESARTGREISLP